MATLTSLLRRLTKDGDFSSSDLTRTANAVVDLGGVTKADLEGTKKLFTKLWMEGDMGASPLTLEQFQHFMGAVTRRYSAGAGKYGSSLTKTSIVDILKLQAGYAEQPGKFARSNEVDLVDPRLPPHALKGGDTPKYEKHRFRGDIPDRIPVITDVEQGWLDNCPMQAALAAVIHTHGEWFYKNCFKRHKDGTFSYRLNAKPDEGGKREWVRVDRDLYVYPETGKALFGRGGNSYKRETMNLLSPLFEKSVAQALDGTYVSLDNGGVADDYMAMIMPGERNSLELKDMSQAEIMALLREAKEKRWPLCLGTFGDKTVKGKAAAKDGIISNHTYTFMEELDASEAKTSDTTYLRLYNIWHSGEAKDDAQLNGKNDGIFVVKAEKLKDYFEAVNWLVPDKKKMAT